MKIEYKSVDVVGVNEVKDEGDGVVTAYVSVTGVEDNVKDVIEPGAYERTLKKRMPKGVWGHQWLTPTSKTLDVKELKPGDPDLPKELADGSPWPKDAGALRIKMQFNLGTTRGREAYSDVKFFDKQQEWSIGYTVPANGSYKDDKGVRHIKDLDLYEYSAVLFGANSHARTATSVKDIQLGAALMRGISTLEVKSLEEAADLHRKEVATQETDTETNEFEGDGEVELPDDEPEGGDDFDDDEADDEELEEMAEEEAAEEEEKQLIGALTAAMSAKELRTAYTILGKVLDAVTPDDSDYIVELGTKALIEAKATGYDTVTDAVDGIDVDIDPADAKSLRDAAQKLDWALKAKYTDVVEESATDLMDVLEDVMDANADDDLSLKTVARTIADKTASNEDDEDYEEGDWEDEDEDDDEEKKSFTYIASNDIEYKTARRAGRMFGVLVGGEDLHVKERQEAFVATLPNRALVALDVVLEGMRGNAHLKTVVTDEIDSRLYSGSLSMEEKLGVMSNGSGQHGRGGGRHRQAAEGRTPGSGRNFGETGRAVKPTAKRLKKTAKGLKKPGVGKTTVNRITGSKKPIKRVSGMEAKRYFNAEERESAAKRGTAMPDESFPIENEKDLKNAIRACGRAKDKDKAKSHIKKRAKDLGLEDMLPDSWKTVAVDTMELKTLEVFMAGIPTDSTS